MRGSAPSQATVAGPIHAQSPIGDGADVIVAGQMILAELVWSIGTMRVADVPIVDALGAVALLAKDLHQLKTVSGAGPTRRGIHWTRPYAAALEQIAAATRADLLRP